MQRRDEAEDYLIALSLICNFPTSSIQNDSLWASDGSMVPATSSLCDPKSITAAVSGPTSIVLQIKHRNASILQGEQVGLVAALVLAKISPTIYTDHLNSTTLINDHMSAVSQDRRLCSMNRRSYYRWILDLVTRKRATVTYTKAHTDELTTPASLNREADHLASTSQKLLSSIPIAPIPTFFMDPYTFHRDSDGWIESNIHYFVDLLTAKSTANALALLPKHWMATWLYDPNTPPTWVYTKAASAYTALIQLYARSGQLPTADGMFQKKTTLSQACWFGCPESETPHHIFSVCHRFSVWRLKELESLTITIQRKLDDADIEACHQSSIIHLAKFIFTDSKSVWPLHSTAFFLGQIPKIEPLLSPLSMTNSVNRSRLIHKIAADLHLSSVRLASRIFGDLQKEISKCHTDLYGNHA